MGFFGAKHDNTDVHAKDPDGVLTTTPEPEIEEPEDPEAEDLTLLVTFKDGTTKTFTCSSYRTPDAGDHSIVLTRTDEKDIWLNERYVVSIEEL